MQLITDITALSKDVHGSALAIGNFDGLHLGHQAILNEARARAKKEGRRAALLTFEPHPRSYFRPEIEPFRLTSLKDKLRFLDHAAWDLVFALPFDQQMAETSAEEFVSHLLATLLHAGAVFVGADFHFGANRRGSAPLLRDLGANHKIDVNVIPPLKDRNGVEFSSTFIREALKAGDLAAASRQLGRHWSMTGTVVKGQQRGRELGFPTANILLGDYLRPAFGVYAVRVEGHTSRYDGIVNIGVRPTFGASQAQLEVHLFDFQGDLYGQELTINLVDFLRPERKFSDFSALQTQIGRDCEKAKDVLEHHDGL